MTEIRGLLFDKDGTLFDFHQSWGAWSGQLIRSLAAEASLHHAGTSRAELESAFAMAMGYDLAGGRFRPDSPVIAGALEDFASPLLELMPHRDAEEFLAWLDMAAHTAPQVEAAPLVPLLSDLKSRGLALGIATNDSEASAQAHLHQAGIAGFFEFVAGYDSGHGAKPAPGMARAYLAHTGVPPGQAVMIGDSTHDLHSGKAAGMLTVGVLTGLATAHTLSPLATAVLASIAELPEWLDARRGTPNATE